jgi:hypothetical protein
MKAKKDEVINKIIDEINLANAKDWKYVVNTKLTLEEEILGLELIVEDDMERQPMITKEYVLEKLRAIRHGHFNLHTVLKKEVLRRTRGVKNDSTHINN